MLWVSVALGTLFLIIVGLCTQNCVCVLVWCYPLMWNSVESCIYIYTTISGAHNEYKNEGVCFCIHYADVGGGTWARKWPPSAKTAVLNSPQL